MVRLPSAKIRHPRKALSDFVRHHADFLSFPAGEDEITEWGGVEGLLILEGWREVDAVVLADIADSLWWEFLSLGRDAHGIEDVAARREVATEGPWTDICQSCQFTFADKTILVVEVNHK